VLLFLLKRAGKKHLHFFDESVGSMTDVSDQVSFYKLIMRVIKLGERRPPQDLTIISFHFLNGNCFSSFLSSYKRHHH
jgi:hypothetical protein